jgi:hypothetical protein
MQKLQATEGGVGLPLINRRACFLPPFDGGDVLAQGVLE